MVPVRLVDGASPNGGRVEVNYQGSWGTICDDSWDIKDATVVCRMLGYPGVSSALMRFGEATGDIILDDVGCDGSETHIAHCYHSGYENHNCEHSGDVGIICSGEAELKVRLVDGPDEGQGRVELFYFGSWGTVCYHGWTSSDSDVVCRMLGFLRAVAHTTYPSLYGHDLQVRLVGGRSDKEGRVEVLYLGTWGTVCDDNWDLSDANVVCRMLGYERAENFSCCAAFGPGPGPIVLDEVECEGTEANIGHCRRSDYETHDCDHSEDVGVLCIEHGNRNLNTTQNETKQEQQPKH
ncbi:deleted in malignant brain tumors 1 protein-like [Strongylocentrotus purpuratus]|uniref:SRCR domain-containing protein n=1 Tax=Strongylocentrotus purpuratus TaxID=7668 RepID=A0A7M7T1K3_STRPU|nr:deleted in malignant brain tumors 1 protein-like [Strongylocentrotus purpuratus]